ncbi:MAG: radical SAM protein [Candidatus Kaelpia imicola]|nr:radical SAM protein [Candidatus Kaelpia imicola]
MQALLISLQKDLDTIGLKYLHYHLLNNGYDSTLLYLSSFYIKNDGGLKEIKRFVLQTNPDFIAISLMSLEYFKACNLTEFLKGFISSTPIIWGGIHPTISPEDCLNYADFVCIGEGERTILNVAESIIENRNIKEINNLCYRNAGIIRRNPLYPPIADLDSLPFYQHLPKNAFILSAKNIIPLDKKSFKKRSRYTGRTYSIISSRGCPLCCTYCCNSFISKLYESNAIRRRGVDNIVKDICQTVNENPEIEYINFQDDCFLAAPEDYFREFCILYKRRVDKPFIIRSIPIYVNREKIRLLKEAGLSWVSLGLQSGSDHTCKEIYGRKSLKSDFLKAAKIIKDFNIAAFYDVITDNPFENITDKLKTIEVLSETPKPFYLQLFSLVLYPGTELYLKAKSEHSDLTEDYLRKDFLIPDKNIINNFIKLTPCIKGSCIIRLISIYKLKPGSIRFKILFYLIYIFTALILEPISYFKVIKLSQRGSYFKTIKLFPIYSKEGFMRYLNRFKTNEN